MIDPIAVLNDTVTWPVLVGNVRPYEDAGYYQLTLQIGPMIQHILQPVLLLLIVIVILLILDMLLRAGVHR